MPGSTARWPSVSVIESKSSVRTEIGGARDALRKSDRIVDMRPGGTILINMSSCITWQMSSPSHPQKCTNVSRCIVRICIWSRDCHHSAFEDCQHIEVGSPLERPYNANSLSIAATDKVVPKCARCVEPAWADV